MNRLKPATSLGAASRTMNIQTYLRRIGYQGTPNVDLDTLRALQLLHLRTVPFENLSIHLQQPIVLDEALLYEKVVERRRGGFCYELNGLFARLLQELGFEVSRLAASVCGDDGNFGPAFDHMTLLVHLQQDFLVDVGFGDSFQEPLLLEQRGEQGRGEKTYRIAHDARGYTLYEHSIQGGRPSPHAQYRFDRTAHELPAFDAMCRYHQTSAASHFTRKRICSIATVDGRVSLSDLRLIVTTQAGRCETVMNSEADVAVALKQYFGIVL
jgi:N-hydroxyarylamine O-acetyltransferase